MIICVTVKRQWMLFLISVLFYANKSFCLGWYTKWFHIVSLCAKHLGFLKWHTFLPRAQNLLWTSKILGMQELFLCWLRAQQKIYWRKPKQMERFLSGLWYWVEWRMDLGEQLLTYLHSRTICYREGTSRIHLHIVIQKQKESPPQNSEAPWL